MGLIERRVSEQADTVTHKLMRGESVNQAEAVGLAQEIVRLHDQLAGAVDLLGKLAAADVIYTNDEIAVIRPDRATFDALAALRPQPADEADQSDREHHDDDPVDDVEPSGGASSQ